MERNMLFSIIAVILGIIIIIFPAFGVAAVSAIIGLAFLFVGIVTLLFSYQTSRLAGPYSTLGMILGILIAIFGLILIFDPAVFVFLASFFVYIAGIILIIIGIMAALESVLPGSRYMGVSSIVLGIIYFICGYFIGDARVLGFLISLWLLISGVIGISQSN